MSTRYKFVSHSRSFKVIQNYTDKYGVCACVRSYLLSIVGINMCLSCAVTDTAASNIVILKSELGVTVTENGADR